MPALGFMLACYLAAMAAIGHAAVAARETAAAGFYTANIMQAWWPYVIGRSAIGPLWSLAQEEQFYLVFPVLLIAVLRWRGEAAMRLLVMGAILFVSIERLTLFHLGAGGQRLYQGPDTHSDGLMLGALLALTLRRPAGLKATRANRLLGPASLVLLGFLCLSSRFPWSEGVSFVDLAAVGLVCAAVCQPDALLTRALRWPPLVGMGKISYSLYLWNVLFLSSRTTVMPQAILTTERQRPSSTSLPPWRSGHRFIEQRFRHRHEAGTVQRRLTAVRQPGLGAGGAVAAESG